MTLFKDKCILLGVTGSIACYKAIDLASKLTQAGALVDVVMTEAAARFVTPLAFRSVTGRSVHTDMWSLDEHVRHVGLGENADLFLIAPATAHTMAKQRCILSLVLISCFLQLTVEFKTKIKTFFIQISFDKRDMFARE